MHPVNRRAFLRHAGLAIAGAAALPLRAESTKAATRVVDTHTHFYDPTRKEGVPWPTPGTPLYRRVLPEDWLAVAEPCGVRETIVVEASELLQDNDWILALAARNPSIIGFVGRLHPGTPDFDKHLGRLASNPLFKGIRIPEEIVLPGVENREFRRGLVVLADHGLSLDLNGAPRNIRAGTKFAEYRPLRIVIDHLGGPGDPAHLTAEWRATIRELASQPNVFCKVSAFMEQTAAAAAKWGGAPRETEYYAPVIEHCWQCFGPDRLIYASNWPVSDKGGTYADQFRIVSEFFSAKGADACEKLFWKNSQAAYRWAAR